jgi:DNA-binding NarL/FixJ family response regulator
MNGLEATRNIAKEFPDTIVIGLSMYDSEDMANAMQSAGARAYLTKEKATEDLCSVIRAVAQGRDSTRPS